MGLSITRVGYKTIRLGGYSTLHWIRYLAVKSEGYSKSWDEFMKEYNYNINEFVDKYYQYRELLNHSDCDGLYIPSHCYPNDNDNIFLGDFDELRKELIRLNQKLVDNPNLYQDEFKRNIKQSFDRFLDLVLDEDYDNILVFE